MGVSSVSWLKETMHVYMELVSIPLDWLSMVCIYVEPWWKKRLYHFFLKAQTLRSSTISLRSFLCCFSCPFSPVSPVSTQYSVSPPYLQCLLAAGCKITWTKGMKTLCIILQRKNCIPFSHQMLKVSTTFPMNMFLMNPTWLKFQGLAHKLWQPLRSFSLASQNERWKIWGLEWERQHDSIVEMDSFRFKVNKHFSRTSITFHFSTVFMSSLLYQPTAILFFCVSISVVVFSHLLINNSCPRKQLNIKEKYLHDLCNGIYVLIIGEWRRFGFVSLSHPAFSYSRAIDRWSPLEFFHWSCSHWGTWSLPPLFSSQSLLNFAFFAFFSLVA